MYFASSFLGLQCMVGAIRQRQYSMLCHRIPLPHNKPHGSSRECCQRKSVSPSQQTWPTFWYCNMTPLTKVTLKNQLINWVIQKKPHNVLSKFKILFWATLIAILGCTWPVGTKLDILGYVTRSKSSGFSHLPKGPPLSTTALEIRPSIADLLGLLRSKPPHSIVKKSYPPSIAP